MRITLHPNDGRDEPVTIELPEGTNLFLQVEGDRLPAGTSLFLNEGRLTFGYHDEAQSDWVETTSVPVAEAVSTCKLCDRGIKLIDGEWVDPEATGDDSIWRTTCGGSETFTAEHEPTES